MRKLTCRKTILAIFLISALIPITAGAQNFQMLVTLHGYNGAVPDIKAGEIHSFKAVGDAPLVQFDTHISPRFIQENL